MKYDNNYNSVDEAFDKKGSKKINNGNNLTIIIIILSVIVALMIIYIVIDYQKVYTVEIISNGANVSSTKVSCNKDGKSCKVKLPEITREGYYVEGYVENKDERTSKYKSLEEIELTSNKTLYVLTFKTLSVRIVKNGATSIDELVLNCTLYNNDKSCKVKLPNIVRDNWEILGYSEDENATEATYKISEELDLTENKVLYAITTKKITAHFDVTGLESIEYTSQSCDAYNYYGCEVKIPSYIEKKGSMTSLRLRKESFHIDDDTILSFDEYVVKNIDVSEQVIYGKTVVEFQNTYSEKENIKKYLDEIYKNWPFLFENTSKIMFLDWDTYEKYISPRVSISSAGVTFTNGNITIRSLNKSVIIHELAHKLDFNNVLSNNMHISATEELGNLFEKYTTPNSPYLTEHAHTNTMEFFATAVEHYYLKYVDGDDNYRYPEDLKQFVEKYLKL
ncbi:MAG: InlB B-repeat-containing protein [Clostridium sp.]|nr:InlB B-repeat-containing protein [Clostridium sp.]